MGLNRFLDWWFISFRTYYILASLTAGRCLSSRAALSMQFHQLANVKLGFPENFNFTNEDVMKRKDALASLLDITPNTVWDQFTDNLFKVIGGNFTGHDFYHLLADCSNLGVLCIACLFDLVGSLLGKTNAEKTQQKAISCLHINIGLNQGLPFLDHRS